MFAAFALSGMMGVSAQAATTNVLFDSLYFAPNAITIHEGDMVMWTNVGFFSAHTVTGTGSDAICGSGPVPSTCSHTFNAAGAYPYICAFPGHAAAGMTGVVYVVKATLPVPRLAASAPLINGQFQFTVTGAGTQTNQVQATTNILGGTNWTTLATFVPTNSTYSFTDSNAPAFKLRFYRVVEP